MSVRAICLALGLLVPIPLATSAETLRNAAVGTPKIQALDAMRFAPDGVLLIGDGRGSQLVAVETGDTKPTKWTVKSVEKIDEKLAGKLGVPAKGIEIRGIAVNPKTQALFIAVLKPADRKTIILTVAGDGEIGEFPLENVKHVAIPLPKGEKSPISRVTDVAWMGDRVLVSAVSSEEFGSKVCSIPAPLDPKSASVGFSTETYHVAHGKWETKAPMTAIMPFEEGGKKYVLGAFACTPVVRYPLDDVQSGSKVKGESVIELGSGNQPRTMLTYEKDGKAYVLMNTFRFHHARAPFGWSPYWTVRMDLGLMKEGEKINEKATQRLAAGKPATDRIAMIEDYHGVMHMDKLDAARTLVIKQEKDNAGTSLAVLQLP